MRTRMESLALVVALALGTGIGCAGAGKSGGASGGGARGGGLGGRTGTTVIYEPCQGACDDFPADPIVEAGGSPSAFSSGGSDTGGPCLLEPEPGALFPFNWLRPRFAWTAPAGQTQFELRIHNPLETNDLVVYTNKTDWTMPQTMWEALRLHVQDDPITMTIRGAGGGGPATGTSGIFTIAPAAASGDMLYWAAQGTTNGDPKPEDTALIGLNVGRSETVQKILSPPDVYFPTKNNDPGGNTTKVQCIGCHTSVPGGGWVVFIDRWPWPMAMAGVSPENLGLVPVYVTAPAVEVMHTEFLGISSTSPAHWGLGDYIVITNKGVQTSDARGDPAAKLIWLDVGASGSAQGVGWGVIARNGDTRGAASPAFSHDGKTIAYASTNSAKDGRLGVGESDIYVVPYNDRQGGAATKLAGAAETSMAEYYPAFSIDDQLVAFTAVPQTVASTMCSLGPGCGMYDAPTGEIYVVRADGSSSGPLRLAANDPPACHTVKSPGATNSWPKWSPDAVVGRNGTLYYWLVFSSKRMGTGKSQLYLTAITIPNGEFSSIGTYSAIRLWNQQADISNFTPAWDIFNLAAIP